MRGIAKKLVVVLVAAVICTVGVFGVRAQSAWATGDCPDGKVHTSILGGADHCVDPDANQIKGILALIVRILMYGLGAAAVIGVVIAGILYLTARDNEQQAVVAKRRLFEIAIGLIAWALVFVVVEWLLPGGLSDDDWAMIESGQVEDEK